MTEQEQTDNYLTTCYLYVDKRGEHIVSYLNGDDEATYQLSRFDLPRGAIGEEMWDRLTMGLPRI